MHAPHVVPSHLGDGMSGPRGADLVEEEVHPPKSHEEACDEWAARVGETKVRT